MLLEGLARLVHDVHPSIDLRVVEGGGVMNHADVGAGRIPVAILNPPMTAAALAGRPPFERALPDLRVGESAAGAEKHVRAGSHQHLTKRAPARMS